MTLKATILFGGFFNAVERRQQSDNLIIKCTTMITSIEVFGKIKEMNTRTLGSLNRILLSDIAEGLSIPADLLLVFLTELQVKGLILIHKIPIVSVSLTNYGVQEIDAIDRRDDGLDGE